jgi:hypothetical protein
MRLVAAILREKKLMEEAKKVEDPVVKTMEYIYSPRQHWKKI